MPLSSPQQTPSALDDYWFDLRGYLILENVLTPQQIDALNTAFDRFPDIAPGEWVGNSQRRDYTPDTGYELHNCLEFDPAFDALIDHPGWIRTPSAMSAKTGATPRACSSTSASPRFEPRVVITLCTPAVSTQR